MDIVDIARVSDYLVHVYEYLVFSAGCLINLSRVILFLPIVAWSSSDGWRAVSARAPNSPDRIRCPSFRRTYVRRNWLLFLFTIPLHPAAIFRRIMAIPLHPAAKFRITFGHFPKVNAFLHCMHHNLRAFPEGCICPGTKRRLNVSD